MGEYKQYTTLIGWLLIVLLVIILFVSPQDIFSSVRFIDTELSEASGGGIPVRTNMDLAQEEQLKDFPLLIEEWEGINLEIPNLREYLDADVLLMRAYTRADQQQPVFLLVMHASSKSGFHPPPICYVSMGYEVVEEEEKEKIYVSDTAWIDLPVSEEEISRLTGWQREVFESSPYAGWVSVKRLTVFKQDNGEVTDRRIVLYFYIKDRMFVSDKISMVRVSALAPPSGSLDDALSATKELMAEVIPLLFQPHEEGKMFITHLVESGIGGYFVILLLFSIPLAIIICPKVLARRGSRSNTGRD
jgi:hypothetical protein